MVRTLAASAEGTHAVLHIHGVACLVFDVAAAQKAEPEKVVWQPAIPGAYPCFELHHMAVRSASAL